MTSERTKNGLPHRVPLSSVALDVLAKAQNLGGTFVFPSPKGDGHIGRNVLHYALQRIMRNTGMTLCTVHDLRRTVATWLAAHRVPESIVGRILNHLSGHSITRRHYNLYGYDDEKRAALEMWGAFLMEIDRGQR